MTPHLQNELTLGRLVRFVCLDAGPSSSADFQFDARCHYIPREGEHIDHRGKTMRVIRVYYKSVSDVRLGDEPVIYATVACKYVGEARGL